MKYEHWQIPAAPEDAIKTLMDAGYPYLVSSVLAARGVTTSEQAAEALEREKTLTYSPFLMKDMDKAVARISRALENGEKLAVFGDYDVDGITSTCLLTDYLRSRGADVTMHIPRRIEEGYGLGCDAIRALSESGVTLIVTVDCGITGVDETAYAATLGVDLVITDHHECKEQLPAAVAVVDPHRPDCPYPFKHLAGVGVALKLVLALGEGREDALFARYCTLAAIGTIADVMRMEGENRTIVQCGLEGIDRSDFTGLHALLREAGLTGRPVSSVQIGFVLAPRINAAGRMGRAELAAEHDTLFTLHASEMDYEMKFFAERGETPTRYLAKIGAVNERLLAGHCIHMTQADIEILAEGNAAIAHCIGSNTKAGKGVAPMAAAARAGVRFGLGTDGPSSGNTLSLFDQMRLFADCHKTANHDRALFPAKEIVRAATRGGAEALRAGGEFGRLQPGMRADLVLVSVDAPHLFPVYNPYSALVYGANSSDVSLVMVSGETLVRGGKLTRLDMREAKARLLEQMGPFMQSAAKYADII